MGPLVHVGGILMGKGGKGFKRVFKDFMKI